MNKKYILIVFLVSAIFLSLNATSASSIYVSPDGNDTNDGISLSSSKGTISNAIENIGPNGSILLSSGTYKGEGNYNITIEKNLTIKGTSSTNKSIIDGENSKNLFSINNGAVVTFENIVFTNAYKTKNGAAVFNNGDSTFINCDFTNNYVDMDSNSPCSECGRGAGIFNIDGNVTVLGCSFINNIGIMYGGAINNRYGENCIIKDSTFINNTAYLGGGAIDTNGGKYMLITNSLFIGNNLLIPNGLIAKEGGAIVNKESNLIVNYCVFYDNYDYYGNTIYNNAGNINADYNFWGTNDISSAVRGFNVNNYYKLIISPTIANNLVKTGETLNYNFYFALNTNGSKIGSDNLPSFNITIYQNENIIGQFYTKNTSIKSTKLLANSSTLKIALNDRIINSYQYTAKKNTSITTISSAKKTINKPDLKIVKIIKKKNKYYIKIKNIGTATAKKNYLGVYKNSKLINKKLIKSLKKGKSVIIKLNINKKYLKTLKKFKLDYKNRVSEKSKKNNVVVFR